MYGSSDQQIPEHVIGCHATPISESTPAQDLTAENEKLRKAELGLIGLGFRVSAPVCVYEMQPALDEQRPPGRLKQEHARRGVHGSSLSLDVPSNQELAELRSKTQSQEEDDGFESGVLLESKLPIILL